MALGELAAGLGRLRGDATVRVQSIAIDSRQVTPGALFVARRGLLVDGHRYAADAVGRGAVAVAVEESADLPGLDLDLDRLGVPVLVVPASDAALAHLACRLHGHPSHELTVVGVTGTNGKTTVTHLVAGAFAAGGRRAAIFGTLGYGPLGGPLEPTEHTTPPAPEYQGILRRLADQGVEAVASEVSSHALKTDRVLGTRFAAAIFTNLTRDHLDFHRDEADYLASKRRLFEREARGDDHPLVAVVNADDPAAPHFIAAAKRSGDRVITTSQRAAALVRVERADLGPAGTALVIAHPGGTTAVRLRLPGDYNIANALGAFAAGTGLGLDPAAVGRGLEAVTRVPGRLERVEGRGDIEVLVDYGHTPDALATMLATARGITRGRLIAVFGCGGDRDRGKRPLMAEVGTRLADRAILTTDNPRSEDPRSILAEMEAGIPAGRDYEVVPDRREAIERAIGIARPGDVVVLAGKGHETVQIIGDRRLPFDDREEARRVLRARATPVEER
jgi:UDP-N-acetylmuramoyl-L-alanyl-D-glutamate--2,6-diaminopimelate ligase